MGQNRLSTVSEYWQQTSLISYLKSFAGSCPQTRQNIVFRGCSHTVAWMLSRELWTICPFQLHCMESLTCRDVSLLISSIQIFLSTLPCSVEPQNLLTVMLGHSSESKTTNNPWTLSLTKKDSVRPINQK